MHILFLTDNFPPEGNAPATRTFEHACEWTKKGHKVTVLTCAPNFPEGKVYEGYKNRWLLKENIENIDVWRVKTYISKNEGFFRRTLDFLSFMISSCLFGIFTRKVDIVIGTSPQFFTIISAWALAKIKRVPFVFELRDIWPASITAVGAMKESWIINFFEKLELFFYKQADLIISVTHSFKLELINRGVARRKIKVILNGVNLSKFSPLTEKDQKFSDLYNLHDKFVIGYIGTHGMAHALDSVLKAAEMLKKNKNIKFLFVGGGADRSRLEKIVNHKKLSNVIMVPRQPKENIQKLWSLCDVSLVSLKDSPLFSQVIPSKIFESMAMGLPILISVPIGEATELIEENHAGIILPPENPSKLYDVIIKLEGNSELLNSFSNQSQVAASKFDRKELAKEMLKYIEEKIK